MSEPSVYDERAQAIYRLREENERLRASVARLVGFAHYPLNTPRAERPLIVVRLYRCEPRP